MPSAFKFIGGGLLTGIGQGLVKAGEEKRKAALADLEQKRQAERDEKLLEGRRGLLTQKLKSDRDIFGLREKGADTRLKLTLDSRGKVASGATSSREDIASQATASREDIAAAANISREKTARIAAGKPKDTTAAEDRIIKRHVELDENEFEIVNHEAAAVELEGRGFTQAAAAQRRKAKGIADVDLQQRAEDFADQMVDEQSGAFSFDSSDFKDDGGSRTRFRARMVREFKAKNGGKAAAATAVRPEATKPATTPSPPATRPEVTGGGTPYVGSTPPRDHPKAQQGKGSKSDFWYIPDPARPGKFLEVQKTEANRR